MRLTGADFQLVRRSVAAVSAAILLGGLVIYASQEYADHAQKNQRAALSQMNEARNRLATAREDQQNLAAYARGYSELTENRIIGDEQRLDWMEGLDRLRDQGRVIDFRYNIMPQKPFVAQPAIDSGNFDIRYSEMKLDFDLLHEGQLLNFLDTLNRQIKGHYQLDGCMIQRSMNEDDESAELEPVSHIRADCSGGWITLKNRNIRP